jgi:hypothetical protein
MIKTPKEWHILLFNIIRYSHDTAKGVQKGIEFTVPSFLRVNLFWLRL